MIPNLSNDAEMAKVGRLALLRSARRKTAQALRDKLVPILNKIEMADNGSWEIEGIVELVTEINELSKMISQVQQEKT